MWNLMGHHHAVSIIQSSGTGKSRGVEETAQRRFTILFNLRRNLEYYSMHFCSPFSMNSNAVYTAYPPPDNSVRDYLTFSTAQSDAQIQMRCAAFLCSLFICTTKLLSSVDRGGVPLAAWWYTYLNTGASPTEPGPKRLSFYQEVARTAEVWNPTASDLLLQDSPRCWKVFVADSDLFRTLRRSCDEFVACLQAQYSLDNSETPPAACILVFDEAQELMGKPGVPQSRSKFRNLAVVLKYIGQCPIFSVFLYSNFNVRSLSPAVGLHPSVGDFPDPPFFHPPITEFPFDVFAKGLYSKLRGEKNSTLSETCTVDVMACFGRTMEGSMNDFWCNTDAHTGGTLCTKMGANLLSMLRRRSYSQREISGRTKVPSLRAWAFVLGWTLMPLEKLVATWNYNLCSCTCALSLQCLHTASLYGVEPHQSLS